MCEEGVSSEGTLPSAVLLLLLAWVYSCSAAEPEFPFIKANPCVLYVEIQ